MWFALSDQRLDSMKQATLEATHLDPSKIDDICIGRSIETVLTFLV